MGGLEFRLRPMSQSLLILIVIAQTIGIFALDLVTPLGLADWLLYVFPILTASRLKIGGPFVAAGSMAAVSSILTSIGYFYSPPGIAEWIAATNRTYGVVLFWLSAVLFFRFNRRRMELAEKEAQLIHAAKLASIGELASGIAHELNNPLNNIGLYVGNAIEALEQGKPVKEIQTGLRAAANQVRRGATIIDHLRVFARSTPTSMEPVSVNAAVKAGLELMREALRLESIAVDLHLAARELVILGNMVQLEQVMINLLSNARDAVAHTPVKRITILTTQRSACVDISVQDTGVGITPEAQGRIFDPFFTTKDVGKGTGLGLSISYGIIKEHGGTIAVISQPGNGATFTVTLPLMENAEPRMAG